PERACTLLDLSHPTCGFNPLAMAAPADVVADHVVGALRNLFTEADIRASSDRYLRNAVIAVLASDPSATLWDAARLLSVGGEGYEYRARVGAMVRGMPAFKEISEFFTAELAAQLNDARSMTTAKLDAPVNKLARLLNSPSIKRVLLNESLRVDLDRVISGCEVLVVKGALGAMGAGNTSVLMQMLMGMLDAALARQQDSVPGADRVAVALKVDEAPLVINRGFAETLALKRSAGLETTACWQTDSQWTDREVRAQLDALFAHRVYFATASVQDARASAALLMAEFADSVRPGNATLSTLGRPDARLHLPKHHAIASFTAPDGRQSPFVAETLPMRVDPARIELHARRQAERGGRYLADLRQPHWERARSGPARSRAPAPVAAQASETIDGPPVGDGSPPDAPAQTGETPAEVGEGYRELVDLDRSPTVRVVPGDPAAGSLTPDEIDLEILRLLDSFRFALTSQIHRRFNAGRAVSTTQRRLKRLSDAGLIARLQFHRRDGAGVPMCCAITASGELALARAGAAPRASTRAAPGRPVRGAPGGGARPGARPALGVRDAPRELAQVRHDIHVLGWALALERALGPGRLRLAGARDSVIAPPSRRTSTGERTVGPRDLRLPGGRTPHGFLRTGPAGEQLEVTRFQSLRPDATVTLARPPAAGPPAEPGGASGLLDVLVERDDRPAGAGGRAKLERYDHFLAGWAMLTRRHGPVAGTLPLVVFICRDRARARECARQADGSLHACQAYAGEYPSEWLYPGRPQILFCAERDVHAGNLLAYGVPALPPPERAERAGGVPGLRAAAAEQRTLLPAH
ncbi:MAG: replication-relaxation family protein, partial [Acidobacteriota bacterium]|nr:replication-relaxation family protein [Acidobacteriota bacterium]